MEENVRRWKDMFALKPDEARARLRDIPKDVVDILSKDPDVGAVVSDAVRNAGLRDSGNHQISGSRQISGSHSQVNGELPEKAPRVAEYEITDEPPSEGAEAEFAGHDDESAGQHRAESAAAAAMKARKEREEREQNEEQAKKLGLMAQIQRLDIGEKSKLARSGDKTVRSILIKDASKQVSMAVMANPKITVQEIEVIAASRNVSDDILREIAGNRDWCKSYTVVLALVNNPKTPIPISLTFMPKLLTRDLRFLAKSKGIPEPVRVTAKRLSDKRKF